MGLLVEKGSVIDIIEIGLLYDDLNDYLAKGENFPHWKKGIYPVREDAQRAVLQGTLFVARIDNQIVGSIVLNHEPEYGYDKVKWQCEFEYEDIFVVRTLTVHPEYMGQGVAKRLLEFAYEYAKGKGIKALRLDVYDGNTPAIKLYEKSGYTYVADADLGYSQYGLDNFRLYEKAVVK